jgi:ketosteroid isomerase-like protein
MAQDYDPNAEVRSTTGPDNEAVREVLERLAGAVTAGDARAAGRLWGTPALVLGDHMAWGIASRLEVEDFFAGAKQQYNARGIVDTRPDILRLEWVTDRIAIVEVRWPYIDAGGDEIGAESSTYIIRREDDGEWMFRAAIQQGEATRH